MLIRLSIFAYIFLAFGATAYSEDLKVSVSIVKNSGGKTEKFSGVLLVKNFPKNIAYSMSFPSTIVANGQTFCIGKIRTHGYDAHFSSKCDGDSYRGSSSINRTLKIAGRTINFIRKVKLKSRKSTIEVTTGRVLSLQAAKNN
jgi:hypothetical protein